MKKLYLILLTSVAIAAQLNAETLEEFLQGYQINASFNKDRILSIVSDIQSQNLNDATEEINYVLKLVDHYLQGERVQEPREIRYSMGSFQLVMSYNWLIQYFQKRQQRDKIEFTNRLVSNEYKRQFGK